MPLTDCMWAHSVSSLQRATQTSLLFDKRVPATETSSCESCVCGYVPVFNCSGAAVPELLDASITIASGTPDRQHAQPIDAALLWSYRGQPVSAALL